MKKLLSIKLATISGRIWFFIQVLVLGFKRAVILCIHGEWKLLYKGMVKFFIGRRPISPDIYQNYDKYAKETKRFVYDHNAIANEIEMFKIKPTISIIVPVYNVPVKWLNRNDN